jgi:cytoskeletal protein CcmA (bactofilin family)
LGNNTASAADFHGDHFCKKEKSQMKFGNRTSGNEGPTDLRSFLGEGTEITGDIRFTEIMRVDAALNGTITSDSGSLLVMEKGRIKATVQAGIVEISGTIEGTITARTSVKIHASGRVYGDIYTPSLIIENGAVFDGKCHMLEGKEQKGAFKAEQKPATAETKNLKTADVV